MAIEKIIKYDLIGATKAGINVHPSKDVKALGMKVLLTEGIPIADCVIMKGINVPEILPSYIQFTDWQFAL